MLDVVQKANCMLVAYIPSYKPYQIHWNFPDFLKTCTQFINFTMWKTAKSSELKRLTGTDENLDCYGNGTFEPKMAITSYLNVF